MDNPQTFVREKRKNLTKNVLELKAKSHLKHFLLQKINPDLSCITASEHKWKCFRVDDIE